MMTLTLAWRNLWRNRRRTLITLIAMSFSLMLVQGFHNLSFGVYAQMIDNGVRAGSGHISIYRGDYAVSRDDRLTFVPADLPQKIAALPGVDGVVERLYLPALAQSSRESRGILLTGIDPTAEGLVNPLLRRLDLPALLPSADGRDALIGSRLLQELRLEIGQKFVVTAQGADGELASELLFVRGTVESGIRNIDRSLVMVGRQRAALLAGRPDAVHEIAIMLNRPDESGAVLQRVRALLPPGDLQAIPWDAAMPNLANAIKLDYASQKFIFLVIVAIVSIGVVNTLLMAVMERLPEFGLLLALGASPWRLRAMVLCEALLLGLIAMLLGSALGSLLTWYLTDVGIDLRRFLPESMEFGGVIFDPVLRATWDFEYMLRMAILMPLLAALAAFYPANRAARTAPAVAMRNS
jgi:ABC-type lipoprotein release transport system permease subunit